MGWHGKTLSFGVVSKKKRSIFSNEKFKSSSTEEKEFFQVPVPFQRNKART